jgi:hypothetical protein
MDCPSCKTETPIENTKVEYIYRELYLGLPAFWGFMTPALARWVTAVLIVVCVGLGMLTVIWLCKGLWLMGLAVFSICLFSTYTVIMCIKSLGKFRVKNHYKCLSCRLEWSWFSDEVKS